LNEGLILSQYMAHFMDNQIKKRGSGPGLEPGARAMVVYANFYQFGRGETVCNGPVESRMLLWCRSGTGSVEINDALHSVLPGRFFILPWGHTVAYRADQEDPFNLGGVHIIPEYAEGVRPVFEVAHHAASRWSGCPERRDADCGIGKGLLTGSLAGLPGLHHLLEYTAARFAEAVLTEGVARQQAGLLLAEIKRILARTGTGAAPFPDVFERMLEFVRHHPARPLALAELADFSGLSRASVARLFRRHLGCSAGEWILAWKMEQAAYLLRTRRLSVAQAGALSGFPDPAYFSRRFQTFFGRNPLEFRNSVRPL